MSLWKVSLNITPEAEEAVTQLLETVFGQPPTVYVDARSRRTTATVYLPRRSGWSAPKQAALRGGLRQIRDAGLCVGSGRVALAKIRREDWAESWKRHFKPIDIRDALLLKPSWSKRQPSKNQAMVILDPGMSFGTGQHPTTRFCLEQLVSVQIMDKPGSFLDIGTGSGILAISAAKLGFWPIRGVDIDPQAVRIARANAKRNGVVEDVQLSCGDVTTMASGRKYDLVCANLVCDLLVEEGKRILKHLKPRGRLVLAGILRSQFPKVRAAYRRHGMRMISFKAEKEWASGAFVFF